MRVSGGARVFALVLAIGCAGVLSVAAWMSPSTAGHGTHTQLGLASCGWMLKYGKPCPTCGMTTSWSHAAEGNLAASFATQPFGSLLAVLTAAMLWGALYVAATGSRLGSVAVSMLRPSVLWTMAGMAGAAWVYKLATTGT